MRPAIRVDQISKLYRLGERKAAYRTLRESLANIAAAPYQNLRKALTRAELPTGEERINGDAFWALRDVSFDVQQGEVVGIIGRNGAGKSTLLKLLSRITEPTSGRIELRGRVSSLLEVGTGFHPELTGRENIHLNGSILGMRHHEIDRKFDEIVAFAGVEDFLDTPVKRYSSGMYVRLAFAVAAHLEPEILIVDEVLAVGDAEFQKKCLGKMQDVARHGRTVLFVSHNMPAVQGLCNRGIVLSRGELVYSGTSSDAVQHYLRTTQVTAGKQVDGRIDLSNHKNSYGPAKYIQWIEVDDQSAVDNPVFHTSQPLTIRIGLTDFDKIPHAQVGVMIKNRLGDWVAAINTGMQPPRVCSRGKNEVAELRIQKLPLVPGEYNIDLSVAVKQLGRVDFVENAVTIRVDEFDVYGSGYTVTSRDGICYLDAEWMLGSEVELHQD